MGASRFDRRGLAIPYCGAMTRTGDECRELPAVNPRRPGYYVPSGRCRVHGGASTGPRTAEGKATVSATARRLWAAAAEAEGKVVPSEALRDRVVAFLDAQTWEQAERATGMSRRTLQRIERRAYCDRVEVATISRVIGLSDEVQRPGPPPPRYDCPGG